jgi:hypothetical protein
MVDKCVVCGVVLVGFLAGCGGSSAPQVTQSEFDLLASRYDDLATATNGLLEPMPSQVPAAGTAQYSGVAGFTASRFDDPATQAFMRSDVDLNVNFAKPANGAITGTFSNFQGRAPGDTTDTPLSGSLAVTSNAVDGDGFQGPLLDGAYLATAAGTLFDGTDNADISVRMNGGFLGPTLKYTDGTLNGTFTVSGSTVPIFGGYLGQK